MGWLAYAFRGSVHYHHDRENGGTQAAIVLTCRQHEVHWDTGQYPELRKPQRLSLRWHSSSNKAVLTPTKSHLLIVLFLWDFGDQLHSNHYVQLSVLVSWLRRLACFSRLWTDTTGLSKPKSSIFRLYISRRLRYVLRHKPFLCPRYSYCTRHPHRGHLSSPLAIILTVVTSSCLYSRSSYLTLHNYPNAQT